METILGLYDWNKHANRQKERAAEREARALEALEAAAPATVLSEKKIHELIETYNKTEAAAHGLKLVIFKALSARKGYKMLKVGYDGFDGTAAALSYAETNDKPQLIEVVNLGKEP